MNRKNQRILSTISTGFATSWFRQYLCRWNVVTCLEDCERGMIFFFRLSYLRNFISYFIHKKVVVFGFYAAVL